MWELPEGDIKIQHGQTYKDMWRERPPGAKETSRSKGSMWPVWPADHQGKFGQTQDLNTPTITGIVLPGQNALEEEEDSDGRSTDSKDSDGRSIDSRDADGWSKDSRDADGTSTYS